MRIIRRMFALAAAAVLCTLGLSPPAQASSNTVLTVSDMASYEYYKSCSDSPPYTCGTFPQTLDIMVQVQNRPSPYAPITVGYQIVNGTAVAGQDFTAAMTGTVTIPANAFQAYVVVTTVIDNVPEPAETFTVKLTSSSVPADISDTGTGTIINDGVIPSDCNLSRADASTVSLTCSNRPPSQRWVETIGCGEEWPHFVIVNGNTVTGNGTSTARCTNYAYSYSSFTVLQ
jgi:hypothetical protein